MANKIIRTDLNINKNTGFFFPHLDTYNLSKPRKLKVSYAKDNGTKINGHIKISPLAECESYSIRTYDVLLGLFRVWTELGKPDPFQTWNCSLRDIATAMDLTVSGKSLKTIALELKTLRTTNIEWYQSFHSKAENGTSLDDINLLIQAKFISKNNHDTKDAKDIDVYGFFKNAKQVTIQFCKELAGNLINYNVPLNLSVYNKLGRHQYAKIFYQRMNVILLSSNSSKTAKLMAKDIIFNILSVETKKYQQHKSHRKQFLEKLMAVLDNKPLSLTKYYLSLNIGFDKQKDDYFLICKSNINQSNQYLLPIFNNNKTDIKAIAQEIASAINLKLNNSNINYYQKLAKHYPISLIHRVIGEYKELSDWNKDIKNQGGYFSDTFHRLAHDTGYKWIKDCGTNCRIKNEVKT